MITVIEQEKKLSTDKEKAKEWSLDPQNEKAITEKFFKHITSSDMIT